MAKKQTPKSKSPGGKVTSKAVLEELKKIGLFGGGLVLGSVAGKSIDKVMKTDATTTGVKAFAKPVLLMGAGAAGSIMLKDPNLKALSLGVGAAGALSAVKVIMKKDVLFGLADFAGLGDTLAELPVYREPVSLSIDRYNPELPALNAVSMGATAEDQLLSPSPTNFEII